jgi:hypothetical protein
MGRRSTPDRMYIARREATLNRFIQERRLSAQRAESLVAGWEAGAARRGLRRDSPDFWGDAQPWIEGQLATK